MQEHEMQINPNNGVWKLVKDLQGKKGITEIAINSPESIFVEREGNFIKLSYDFTPQELEQFILDVAQFNNKVCDLKNPILDGSLPDGSRFNAILSPFSYGSSSVTIRKYLPQYKQFNDDSPTFGLNGKWNEFFKALVKSRMNVVVSGGTGAGKTTFLNMLIQEIDPRERLVTIEDTIELNVLLPNAVRLEAGQKFITDSTTLTTEDLVKNTLRMRPDRIIIGESRGGEFFDLLQAMNTGHEGSMTSIHANSALESLSRMENLFLLSGHDLPNKVVRQQITSAIDFVVHITKRRDNTRFVSEIIELSGMERDVILHTKTAYIEDDDLVFSGVPPRRSRELVEFGGLAKSFFEQLN